LETKNNFKVGDIVLTLEPKDKEFYYKLVDSYLDNGGATWFTIEGVSQKDKSTYPLLHMHKRYVKLEKSETKILLPKQIGKRYVVKVNNQPVFTSETRKEAFGYIATLTLNETISEVSVVRETVSEYALKTFKPQISTVLVASDLDLTIE
jgi:hypothetical protein